MRTVLFVQLNLQVYTILNKTQAKYIYVTMYTICKYITQNLRHRLRAKSKFGTAPTAFSLNTLIIVKNFTEILLLVFFLNDVCSGRLQLPWRTRRFCFHLFADGIEPPSANRITSPELRMKNI